MKLFGDIVQGVVGAILSFIALISFLWGVFELFVAETQSPFKEVRIDPTIAIGWLLVSLIIGLLASKVMSSNQK